ncbi:MAG: hypothetical protein QXX51_00285 [Candidatus Bathyarchaeia archaeon]
MELTEKERLMLVEKKEEIRRLTTEILGMASNPKNELEIKKGFTSILAHLNTIASYSDCQNYDLDRLTSAINALFITMRREERANVWVVSPLYIEVTCNHINSIRFNFTKRDVKIHLPKIDISIFRTNK